MTAPRDIQEQLRAAIRDCGISAYRLAINSGVSHAALSLFRNRKRGLTMDSAALLATALGLELRPKLSAGKGNKGKVDNGKRRQRK